MATVYRLYHDQDWFPTLESACKDAGWPVDCPTGYEEGEQAEDGSVQLGRIIAV